MVFGEGIRLKLECMPETVARAIPLIEFGEDVGDNSVEPHRRSIDIIDNGSNSLFTGLLEMLMELHHELLLGSLES